MHEVTHAKDTVALEEAGAPEPPCARLSNRTLLDSGYLTFFIRTASCATRVPSASPFFR
jgi:hypothetical protein